MKNEAPSQGIEGNPLGIKPVRCPASLKAAAKEINANHRATQSHEKSAGSHHRSALRHAIITGALLHYVKSQLKHGEWLPWLKANFDGSERLAQRYMTIARAWANTNNCADLSVAESIDRAREIAQTLPVEKDLPPHLPGLMDPPKLRVVKDQPEQSEAAAPSGDDGELSQNDDRSAEPLWTAADIEEELKEAYRQQAKRKVAQQAASQASEVASTPPPDAYPLVLAVLDAVSRAQGALRREGHNDLLEDMTQVHLLIRGVVTQLHAKGATHV